MNTRNKEVIKIVNEGFAESDIEKILSQLTDDVTWEMIGGFTIKGKEAIRKVINTDGIIGKPVMTIKNEISEGDCVAVEGNIQCKKKDGGIQDADFFDFYSLENGKVKEMRSYVIEKK